MSARSGSAKRSPSRSGPSSRSNRRRDSAVCRRIGSRISCRYAWPRSMTSPSRASATAGAKSSRHGSEPWARCAASRPGTTPGTATEAWPMRKLLRRAAGEVDHDLVHRHGRAAARDGGEEVVQGRPLLARAMDEQEAAAARPGQRALGDPGGRARGDRGVDGVPARLEHVGAGPRGQRMPRCNRTSHGASLVGFGHSVSASGRNVSIGGEASSNPRAGVERSTWWCISSVSSIVAPSSPQEVPSPCWRCCRSSCATAWWRRSATWRPRTDAGSRSRPRASSP